MKKKNLTPVPPRNREAAALPILPDRGGERINSGKSEVTPMQKKIKQNHPCCEGHGLWVQFNDSPSKKSIWHSFSTGVEIPPSSGAGYSNRILLSAHRMGQANHSAGICGRGIPVGAARSETMSHGFINTNAGHLLTTEQLNILLL